MIYSVHIKINVIPVDTIHFRINTVTVIKIFDMLVFIIFGDNLNCKFTENVYSMTVTKWTQSSVLSFEALLISFSIFYRYSSSLPIDELTIE